MTGHSLSRDTAAAFILGIAITGSVFSGAAAHAEPPPYRAAVTAGVLGDSTVVSFSGSSAAASGSAEKVTITDRRSRMVIESNRDASTDAAASSISGSLQVVHRYASSAGAVRNNLMGISNAIFRNTRTSTGIAVTLFAEAGRWNFDGSGATVSNHTGGHWTGIKLGVKMGGSCTVSIGGAVTSPSGTTTVNGPFTSTGTASAYFDNANSSIVFTAPTENLVVTAASSTAGCLGGAFKVGDVVDFVGTYKLTAASNSGNPIKIVLN